jgi:hypothetical protein
MCRARRPGCVGHGGPTYCAFSDQRYESARPVPWYHRLRPISPNVARRRYNTFAIGVMLRARMTGAADQPWLFRAGKVKRDEQRPVHVRRFRAQSIRFVL